ncbi:MAG: methionyl-tRNA formyltransferase [Ignavibacteriaceae bacterium]|nr:methionyl-tRNA formyltransferase [Ignavibacteriaceae bacterium]
MSVAGDPLKVVFWGTPDFAVPSLDAIFNSRHEVVGVVTATDKAKGRGQKVSFSPVKEYAAEKNIPVLQPAKLKSNPGLIESLNDLNYHINVVVAFRILPPELFTLPPLGSINLHGSLLPDLRGAAPIQWALIKGYTQTGLTTFKIEEKVDTGNILLQSHLTIFPFDDFGTLHDKMSFTGAHLLVETLDLISGGNYKLLSQGNGRVENAPKITRDICTINWSRPASEVHNLVRGLSPFPGAFFLRDGKVIKIYKSEPLPETKLSPGEILQNKKELIIGCASGSLKVLEIQKEGHRRMPIDDFLRGSSL